VAASRGVSGRALHGGGSRRGCWVGRGAGACRPCSLQPPVAACRHCARGWQRRRFCAPPCHPTSSTLATNEARRWGRTLLRAGAPRSAILRRSRRSRMRRQVRRSRCGREPGRASVRWSTHWTTRRVRCFRQTLRHPRRRRWAMCGWPCSLRLLPQFVRMARLVGRTRTLGSSRTTGRRGCKR
jgi:hypothetical protein